LWDSNPFTSKNYFSTKFSLLEVIKTSYSYKSKVLYTKFHCFESTNLKIFHSKYSNKTTPTSTSLKLPPKNSHSYLFLWLFECTQKTFSLLFRAYIFKINDFCFLYSSYKQALPLILPKREAKNLWRTQKANYPQISVCFRLPSKKI